MIEYPKLLTFEAYCPVKQETCHIPMHDCVRIHWELKQIQFFCMGCKGNHTIQFK